MKAGIWTRAAAGAAVGVVAGLLGLFFGSQRASAEDAEEVMSADLLAVQLRRQGFVCTDPQSAEKDAERSKPNEAVWLVTCANTSYRMRIVPNMAAAVEEVPKPAQ